jgi:hypothetical protein
LYSARAARFSFYLFSLFSIGYPQALLPPEPELPLPHQAPKHPFSIVWEKRILFLPALQQPVVFLKLSPRFLQNPTDLNRCEKRLKFKSLPAE